MPWQTFMGAIIDVLRGFAVRQTITKCFGTLLQLLPLEAGIPDPEGLSEDLVR